MYLFTRAGRLAPGSVREGMHLVTTITDKAHQATGLDLHTWGASMSPELGTVVWAAFVDSLADLEAAEDKLAVADDFLELAAQLAQHTVGGFSDGLCAVVTGEIDRTAPLPSYVTVARTRAANGRLREAMAAGIEIADMATQITGVQTSFLVDATGAYGGCRWNTGHADITSVERAEAALMADERWTALIDRVGPAFTNDTTQALYRRII